MATTNVASPRLGDLLVEKGYIAAEQLQAALAKQHQDGRRKLLGEILIEDELCSEDHIVECLAAEYGLPVHPHNLVPLTQTRLGSWLAHVLEVAGNDAPFETTLRLVLPRCGISNRSSRIFRGNPVRQFNAQVAVVAGRQLN